MEPKITLKQYGKEDEQALTDIIRKTWHYDDFGTPKNAAKLAKVFLYSCLTDQTYTQVAAIDGQAVGVIMANNVRHHKCPLKYRLKQIASIISLYLTREGRKASKIFGNVSGIDKELLKSCETDYPGEVSFFAINEAYRGMGIGKILFQKMLSYMKAESIPNFYLFTDTSCNFGFYEHQGMKRRQEQKMQFTINEQTQDMNFFLYDYYCA